MSYQNMGPAYQVAIDKKHKRKKTPISFDMDHIVAKLYKKGVDPFEKLAGLIADGKLDDDLRLAVNVMQYLGDHVKAKPKQIDINANVTHNLADILSGLGKEPNP